ncbi:hypothetical protein L6452_44068 [Arctium lappa]|uniref:Uncharacterized protein n=1 Tax=Arctium lappa TaxID=4217 RepID=A0ACB8XFU1_ARCLA|nr:hypothetical protein L6452_44068 [Arctium lappa]
MGPPMMLLDFTTYPDLSSHAIPDITTSNRLLSLAILRRVPPQGLTDTGAYPIQTSSNSAARATYCLLASQPERSLSVTQNLRLYKTDRLSMDLQHCLALHDSK